MIETKAGVAQMEERLSRNQDGVGSIPTSGTILTAHQPVFMAWCGLFAKIIMADAFVVFDDVPMERHSYANRVQIKTQHGVQWLTIPVKMKGHISKPLRGIEIAPGNWKRKHLRTIELAYAKAPYFETYWQPLKAMYSRDWKYLAGICRWSLNWLMAELNIMRPIMVASEQDFRGQKSELVLDMCRKMGARRYIFGSLGKDYADVPAFEREGVAVEFQNYRHPIYAQLHGAFVPGLSVIDLLMNHGPAARAILETGIQ